MKVEILSKNGVKVADLNRRKAIHERCLNCSAWYHAEVTGCTFKGCPLYPFRTGKGKQDAKARGQAIKDYCKWCMAGQVSEVRKCVSETCPLFHFRGKDLRKPQNTPSNSKNDYRRAVFETETGKTYYGDLQLNISCRTGRGGLVPQAVQPVREGKIDLGDKTWQVTSS